MRSVLAGMVVDKTVCGRIASQWPEHNGLFDVPWANLVGGWCVEHFKKYGEPPNGQLRNLFDEWSITTRAPKETVEGVEKFIQMVDDERDSTDKDKVNSDYVLDQAGRHFNEVRAKELIAQAENMLEVGREKDAEVLLTGMIKVELGNTAMVNVESDWDFWRKSFDESQERSLISYPGKLQNFLGRWLQRDTLFGFMAPDKTGKSVFLMDLAVRAIKNRNKVAYFDVGDNSIEQLARRLGSRVAHHPGRETLEKVTDIPISVNREGEVETRQYVYKEPITAAKAFKAVGKLCRGMDRLRLICYPNGTASVVTIATELQRWEQQEGWVPDVVVIDYADILAPPPGVRETLDQIDGTWKHLRRLSQEKHCLVVTATQASAAAYGEKAVVLKKQHFSGRKTKLAHVNGMIGINVSDKDRKAGVTRLNWIVRREGRYSENDRCIVAGCWACYDPVRCVAD
jgi:hypothetical protein